MRIPRIFENQSPLKSNQEITLDEYGAGHISRVLRLKAGDLITIFDGEGHEFKATLSSVGKKVSVLIGEPLDNNRESPLQIELLQVLSRGDRMDFTIQKAVELGISSIVPLTSERCGVKLDEKRADKKLDSYQKIAIAACEQSGRSTVPPIKSMVSLDKLLEDYQQKMSNQFKQTLATLNPTQIQELEQGKLMCSPEDMVDQDNFVNLTLDPRAQIKIDELPNTQKYRILIGPEGGFSAQEVAKTYRSGFIGVTLGPRILRTETAALVTLSILGAKFGDL